MTTLNNEKPKWLAVLLFTLSLAYLIPEIVFNAKLVEVAGSGLVDEATLHLVELFGRSISGIGVTLLIADLLLKGRLVAKTSYALFSLVIIACLVWPTVFFGQKLLIDKVLIEPSSPKQRQEAFFSSVLRSSLAANALKIEGLPYQAEHAASPSEMTFLALMGGLVYSNDEFIQHVDDKKKQILHRYVKNRANADFESYYQDYKGMQQQILDSWKTYQNKVKSYNQALNSSASRANTAWEEVESQIAKGWKDYRNAEKAYFARAEARAQSLAPKIYDHFEDRNRCFKKKNTSSRDRCINSEHKQYAKTLKKAGLPYKDMDYWLTREVKRTKGTTTLNETVMSLGLSALLAGLEIASGDEGEEEVNWVYTNSVDAYTPRILVLWQDKFNKETGYPMGIKSSKDFRSHPTTAKKVRQKVAKQGIALADSWKISQITTFKNTVKKRVKKVANQKWASGSKANGISMKPNLSWKQFQLHSDIQQRILNAMGERNYVKPMRADWNNKQFYDKVIKVNIQRETNHWLRYIESAQAQFADGAPLEENGKSALRSIIVPPISMSLSLLLVLLTVLKLPFKFWALIDYDKDFSHTSHPSEKYIGHALSCLLLAAIFVVPLVLGSSKFTNEKSTTHYFFNKFEESVSPLGSLALKWVLHTQPLVQPVGLRFDQNFKVTQLFKQTLEHPLGELDNVVMARLNPPKESLSPEMRQSLQEQKQAIMDTGTLVELPFFLDTQPKNATIRIMSIKPKYKRGMLLPAGNYDIQVSAAGFETERFWLSHNEKTPKRLIKLTPIKQQQN